jgi:hypothetical protein
LTGRFGADFDAAAFQAIGVVTPIHHYLSPSEQKSRMELGSLSKMNISCVPDHRV